MITKISYEQNYESNEFLSGLNVFHIEIAALEEPNL